MDFDINKSKKFLGNGLFQKTLFDGRLSVKQLLLILVVIIAIVIVVKLLTGVWRTITTIVIIVLSLLRFGLISPAQMKDVGKKVEAEGISSYSQYINKSENIRATDDNKIQINLGDEWVSIDQIESIMTSTPLVGNGDKISVSVDGEVYEIDDRNVADLLKKFTDGNFLHQMFGTFKER